MLASFFTFSTNYHLWKTFFGPLASVFKPSTQVDKDFAYISQGFTIPKIQILFPCHSNRVLA
jgi:hypothetical protein